MKTNRFLFVILIVLMCALFSGCKQEAPSQEQIISDIPNSFITVYVDGSKSPMNIEKMELIKRQTNEKDDHIYCTLTMSNSDFELTADCYFCYNYYDEGGWVLDYGEIQNNLKLVPLTKIPEIQAAEIIRENYSNFELIMDEFSSENGTVLYGYHVYDDYDFCSFSGTINVEYTLDYDVELVGSGYEIDARWYSNESGLNNFSCVWNVEGEWYAQTASKYELELNVLSIDNNFIEVEATNYYEGDPYSWYDGELEYFNEYVEVEYDYSSHGEPSLFFEFQMTEAAGWPCFDVTIYRDHATIRKDLHPVAELYKVG